LNLLEIKKENSKITIDTNTVLNKFNYKNLDILFKFLSYFPITRSQIVQLYSLYLFTFEEKKKLYISYDDFAPYI
jgi:MoaA/NifB/PqqE/SkfB family radical SAM enzyme